MDEIEDFFNISKEFKRVSANIPVADEAPSTSRKIKRECNVDLQSSNKCRKVNNMLVCTNVLLIF